MNTISESAVTKLGMCRSNHPAPYELVMLKEGAELHIVHSVLVSFSIVSHKL